jgi:hypothetical protein
MDLGGRGEGKEKRMTANHIEIPHICAGKEHNDMY